MGIGQKRGLIMSSEVDDQTFGDIGRAVRFTTRSTHCNQLCCCALRHAARRAMIVLRSKRGFMQKYMAGAIFEEIYVVVSVLFATSTSETLTPVTTHR